MLAQYMGHNIRVHRQFYRLPNDVLQTSKLAKLFLLMDCGQLTSQKGKSLDELLMDVSIDCDFIGKWVRPLYFKYANYFCHLLLLCVPIGLQG